MELGYNEYTPVSAVLASPVVPPPWSARVFFERPQRENVFVADSRTTPDVSAATPRPAAVRVLRTLCHLLASCCGSRDSHTAFIPIQLETAPTSEEIGAADGNSQYAGAGRGALAVQKLLPVPVAAAPQASSRSSSQFLRSGSGACGRSALLASRAEWPLS